MSFKPLFRSISAAAVLLARARPTAQAATRNPVLARDGSRARRTPERHRERLQRVAGATTRSMPVFKGTYDQTLAAGIAASSQRQCAGHPASV